MLSKVLLTSVDNMVDYIKEHNPTTVTQLKQKLNVSSDAIEKWLTVLEENGVLKVKYKGLEAYVEYAEKISKEEEKSLDVELLKDMFIRKCKSKQLSYDKIRKIWPLFVAENEVELKKMFSKKAKSEGFEMSKLDSAWEKYKKDLVRL